MENEKPIVEEKVVNQEQNKNINQDDKTEELNLDKFGDLEIKTGGSKPTFDKITKALIKSATLMTSKERQTKKDKSGKDQTFYPIYLKLVYEIDGKEVYENFGGGRLFVSEETKEKRLWVGDGSALGKLRKKLEDNFEFKGTLKEITPLIIGQQVGIKTIEMVVGANTFKKNLIEVFY